MGIAPYIHRCVVQSGDMAGSKNEHTVTSLDIEYDEICDNCHNPVATKREILAHIYSELLSS